MLRFIFYVILFYIIVKALNAFFRWWNSPAEKSGPSSQQKKGHSNFPKYKDVEEAEFTEIKTDSKKEKV